MLSENGEVVKNIKTIEGKFISERVNEFVSKNEEQTRKQEQARQEQARQERERQQQAKDNNKQEKEQQDKTKARSALEELKNTYSQDDYKNYNPGNYFFGGKIVAANKFLVYLADGVLDNLKLQNVNLKDYEGINDANLKNYMTYVTTKKNLSDIFNANILKERLVFKKRNNPAEASCFLKDILKIGFLAKLLYPEALRGKFGRFVSKDSNKNINDLAEAYNKVCDQAINEVKVLLEQINN